jgi:transporter family-2 protein
MSWLLFLSALAAGTANPFQSGVNAQLNKQLGQPLWASIVVYVTGRAGLIALQLCFRPSFPSDKILGVSWWAWLGGLISIVPTVIGLTIAQRLGSGLFTGASVTAALVTSVLLDHFALIGFRQHPASPARVAGCALMIAGLWLIARF